MNLEQLIKMMATFLAKEDIRYFTFGAVAMDIWVPPRSTADLDLVLCVDRRDVPKLITQLNTLDLRITKSLQRKLTEGRIIKLKIGLTALDLKLCTSDYDLTALERAEPLETDEYTLWVATPEDIVLYKLQPWRRQDQADIEKIILQVDDLDVPYIESWLEPLEAETGFPVGERWHSFGNE